MTTTTITLDEQIECCLRELSMRRRVYPRWVQIGRITQEHAGRQIALMQAVVDTLNATRPEEPQQGALL